MITNEEKETVISNATGKSITYKIDGSSHIFDILRNKLYSNGRESLIRELMCNARDSHAEAGKADVPIKVWISNTYLTIQDFGTGISPERMEEVFCWYGRSTKRDTNDQDGFFGLGAKSFFAYASSASITSVYNGVKYEYISFLNDTQVGEIKLVSEGPTDEENGVAIKIPINYGDGNIFREYVTKYAQFWDVQPELYGHNNLNTQLTKPEVLLKGTNWVIYKNQSAYQYNVLLNGIPYKYDCGWNTLPQNATLLLNTGEMVPSATRENLTKNEFNDSAFNKAAENCKSEIKAIVKEQIKNCKSVAETLQYMTYTGSIEWNWGGGTFRYPLEDGALCYRRSYSNYTIKNMVSRFENIKDSCFLLVDDDFDYSQTNSAHTRKVNYYRTKNKLSNIYLVKKCHGIPDAELTKFNDIKIEYSGGGSNRQAYVKKADRTWIFARIKGKQKRERIEFNYKDDIVYTTDLEKLYKDYSSLGLLSCKIVELDQGDIKLIKDRENWRTLQEHLDYYLLDEYNKKDRLLSEYSKLSNYTAVNLFGWLKGSVSNEFDSTLEGSKLTTQQVNLTRFLEANNEIDLSTPTTPNLSNLIEEYPLLKLVNQYNVKKDKNSSYYSDSSYVTHQEVIDYVKLINTTKEEKETI